MTFLRSVSVTPRAGADLDHHPFDVPAIDAMRRSRQRLRLHRSVTFFVGDNGSGKSTLLEAIAVNQGFNAEGGTKGMQFSTRDDTVSASAHHVTVSRSHRVPEDFFFLRAESFFNVATAIDEYGSIGFYGHRSLHERSHGESFIDLLVHRFAPRGLYLMDEPEAALSVHGQLQLLVRLHDLVAAGCQFVIATHSPILLADPHATILHFVDDGPESVAWHGVDSVRVTTDFLTDRDAFLDELLADDATFEDDATDDAEDADDADAADAATTMDADADGRDARGRPVRRRR